jgi:hypothetical protein
MNKKDILKGKFDKKSVDSLSTKEKSDMIYSLHSPCTKEVSARLKPHPLEGIGEFGIENITKFLKLCMKTNQDNVEWFLLHITDFIRCDHDMKKSKKIISEFQKVKTFNILSKYLAKDKGTTPWKSTEIDKYNVWFSGNSLFPLEDEIKRIEEKKKSDTKKEEEKTKKRVVSEMIQKKVRKNIKKFEVDTILYLDELFSKGQITKEYYNTFVKKVHMIGYKTTSVVFSNFETWMI